ncbi:hypothetical protein GMOD_00005560 [Pyrenophora seminiperda CCB06]|uniref:Uncharacterized protein n=1 Tax=Pyrenophora seminiperda CCB06 TaxID=1302712 RepID=A0A3M7M984_9PLEO|nr:hypothetical protein GMOD_00005560 [Pyrenophora seminiperda CCB06]
MQMKRSCPLYPFQDGVCGCRSFWGKRKRSNRRSNRGAKTMALPVSGDSKSTPIIIADSDSEEGILRDRKRQKRDQIMLSGISQGVAMIEWTSQDGGKSLLSGGVRQDGETKKQRKRKKNKEREEETKMKANKPMQQEPTSILANHDLPSGADRLSWDTDEVRRMVGEIA